jgi:hypothetical protein
MPKTEPDEAELLAAFDKGALKSVATKAERAKFKVAARATALRDKRVTSACRLAICKTSGSRRWSRACRIRS